MECLFQQPVGVCAGAVHYAQYPWYIDQFKEDKGMDDNRMALTPSNYAGMQEAIGRLLQVFWMYYALENKANYPFPLIIANNLPILANASSISSIEVA
jgi:hypothetical protein